MWATPLLSGSDPLMKQGNGSILPHTSGLTHFTDPDSLLMESHRRLIFGLCSFSLCFFKLLFFSIIIQPTCSAKLKHTAQHHLTVLC